MLAETSGILIVDKPAGVPAHDVMKAVKQRFNLVKIGHGGSLETNASGVYVLLLGDATRLGDRLASADRVYAATLRLGRETDTYDTEGRTLAEHDAAAVDAAALDAALKECRGDVFQTPPAFSAVKTHGSAAYEVLRTCEEADRRPYLAHVYRASVTKFEPPRAELEIACTKALSVRVFAHDVGAALGYGACLAACRRLACGPCVAADAVPFMDLLQLDAVAFRARVRPPSALKL